MDFAFGTGTPEFLCKGVCLGGALHRNPGMKRTETRDSGMSRKKDGSVFSRLPESRSQRAGGYRQTRQSGFSARL